MCLLDIVLYTKLIERTYELHVVNALLEYFTDGLLGYHNYCFNMTIYMGYLSWSSGHYIDLLYVTTSRDCNVNKESKINVYYYLMTMYIHEKLCAWIMWHPIQKTIPVIAKSCTVTVQSKKTSWCRTWQFDYTQLIQCFYIPMFTNQWNRWNLRGIKKFMTYHEKCDAWSKKLSLWVGLNNDLNRE